MAPELSSNWKKLQAQIKAESSSSSSKPSPAAKRKSAESDSSLPTRKRARVDSDKKEQPRQRKQQQQQQSPQTKPKMGAVHSSKMADGDPKQRGKAGAGAGAAGSDLLDASLALWAEDNDVSLEDIAQAYGLGVKNNSLLSADSDPASGSAAAARENAGLTPGLEVGKYIAIDCEMVGVGEDGREDALARASVVDFHGRQVYDSFVRPRAPVKDWRTHVSGVGPGHMASARPFAEVQAQVAELMRGRIVVGHDIRHDLQALELEHPPRLVRDTARYSKFKQYGHGPKPALRVLARELLGVDIHRGQHSSVEDARVTMLLFRKFKSAFDVAHAARYPEDNTAAPSAAPKAKAKPKKPKRKKRKN